MIKRNEAEINVNDADLIITVGTSLKVLTAYKVLWPKKTKIVVINLQWTPKTKKSVLAINEKRDDLKYTRSLARLFISGIISHSIYPIRAHQFGCRTIKDQKIL